MAAVDESMASLPVLDKENRVRNASFPDLEAVVKIEEMSFPNPWSKEDFAQFLEDIFLVYEQDRKILGFIVAKTNFSPHGKFVHIENLAVDPAQRMKGVATSLLRELLKICQLLQAEMVWLEVRVGNCPAICLYEKFGFKKTATLEAFYEDGEDGYRMEKALREEK